MELYRAETYKQLQVLNLLDVVIVSKREKTSLHVYVLFFFSFNHINIHHRKVVKVPNF
jgi:hypothetical protein